MDSAGGRAGEPTGEGHVAVARVGKVFGLRGEVVLHRLHDAPDLFRPGRELVLVRRDERRAVRLAALKEMPKKLVVRFADMERVEDVEPWVGSTVEALASDLPPLEPDSYYYSELIGLEVYAADGRFLGTLQEILETGGNDVYVVRDGRREFLVPAIQDAIASVDREAGRMVLKDLEGLIEP